MVRAIETPIASRVANADGGEPFLRLPFEEAIQEFERRALLSSREIVQLRSEYALRGEEAARLMLQQLSRRVADSLDAMLSTGTLNLQTFAQDVVAERVGLGIESTDPWYTEMVFRTNVGAAYGAGRERQMLDNPAVVEAFPFIEIRATNDSRTRPNHAAMSGIIIAKNDPRVREVMAPFGFSCRCTNVSRGPEYASRAIRVDDMPPGAWPDAGWARSPIEMIELTRSHRCTHC